jgi:H+-transporting ATPase
MAAFVVAQLISSIIAAFGNWTFTNIHSISGSWIGIVWVWVSSLPLPTNAGLIIIVCQNIIWFIPLDWIKFAMKATVIKQLRARAARQARPATHEGVQMVRTQSRAASLHESLYENRVSFIKRAARKVGFGQKVSIKPEEIQRFTSIQAHRTGVTLARNPSRTANV